LEEFRCGEQMAQTSGRCFPGSKEGFPKVKREFVGREEKKLGKILH
jgi:hypothetical protein